MSVTLSVKHRTVFTYSEPARENVNEVRVCPLANSTQHPEFFVLKVVPATRLRKYNDLFANPVHQFEINSPHRKLVIESRAIVTVGNRVDYEAMPYGVTTSELPALLENHECCEFLGESTYVRVSPEVWREAIDVKGDVDDVFQTAYDLMQSVYERCEYLPGVTTAETHADEVFQAKRGVCQDFAHLLIAYCRSLQIPARYVSGYLWDPGHNHLLRGVQASHAWVEIYLPGHGWIGLDPTNNKVVNEQYVAVATGRDYDDVTPVRGTFYGGGHHRGMEVVVEVKPAREEAVAS